MPGRRISAACQPAATAPKVSQVWQATRHISKAASASPEPQPRRLPVRAYGGGLIIDAEAPLEDIQQAGSLELSPGNLGRVVGQREKPETGVSQFPKRVRYFRVRRH